MRSSRGPRSPRPRPQPSPRRTVIAATPTPTDAGANDRAPAPRPRRPRPRLVATVYVLAAVAIALDRVTKAWALRELPLGEPQEVLGTLLRFTLVFNPGAAFSIGTGITPVFTTVMVVVSVAVLVAAWRVASAWWAVALGFLLGGAVGNLIDRLTRPPSPGRGEVVDFIHLPNFPVFNVADICVSTAAVLVAVAVLRGLEFDGSHARPAGPRDRPTAADDRGATAAVGGGADDAEEPEARRG